MVDDDPDICLTLMEIFKQNGFIADSFTDPLLALDNFKAGLYDLLLLDIKMPEMNGFQLHQEMKKIDNTVKFCFLTAGEENTFYGYGYLTVCNGTRYGCETHTLPELAENGILVK